MEPEHKLANETLASNRPLSAPHFDEEDTLLSARRVVPFHELKAEANSRRRLVFGLTMVSALVIGALAGTLLFTRREKQGRTWTVETAQPASDPVAQGGGLVPSPGETGAPAIVSDGAETLAAEEKDRTTKGQVKGPNTPAIVRNQAARVSISSAKPANASEIEQGGPADLNYERQVRRAERREARRLRREAREKAQSSDDLLRIREIFEGSPRPK